MVGAPAAVRTPRIAILTRPQGRNENLASMLERVGWQVFCLPALQINALALDPACVPRPESFDLVVFVSGNAARLYREQLTGANAEPHQWPAHVPAATVGPASAAGLRESGWFGANTTVLHPGEDAASHDSEALWDVLCKQTAFPNRVLLVRGTQGRDWLSQRLQAHNIEVTRHAAYERSAASWSEPALEQLSRLAEASTPVTWLLTSGEGIDAVRRQLQGAGLLSWWQHCGFVLTHPSLVAHLGLALDDDGSASMVKICKPHDESIFQAFVAA